MYEAENKILGVLAKQAYQNYQDSKDLPAEIPVPKFKRQLELFIDKVRNDIDKDGEFDLGSETTAKIIGIIDGAFIYSFKKRDEIKYRLLFSDLITISNYPNKISRTIDIRDMEKGYLKMIGKYPYYFRVFSLISNIPVEDFTVVKTKPPSKNYVLIIDEINRANLSSVLGELIYALEYRGESVESMYAIAGDNKLILPPNLYIIGTMNTADRSVGHIDYAIRRRFAFVDIPPKDLSSDLGTDFMHEYYNKIYNLFYNKEVDCLSSEFEPGQVCLGHSYFIQQYKKDADGKNTAEKFDFSLRLKYEIVPILEEYVRDGVLRDNEQVRNTIAELKIKANA